MEQIYKWNPDIIYITNFNEVMTESHMKHFFGIELKKIIFEEEDLLLETMVPRALGLCRDVSTCKFNEEI